MFQLERSENRRTHIGYKPNDSCNIRHDYSLQMSHSEYKQYEYVQRPPFTNLD